MLDLQPRWSRCSKLVLSAAGRVCYDVIEVYVRYLYLLILKTFFISFYKFLLFYFLLHYWIATNVWIGSQYGNYGTLHYNFYHDYGDVDLRARKLRYNKCKLKDLLNKLLLKLNGLNIVTYHNLGKVVYKLLLALYIAFIDKGLLLKREL